MEEGFAYSDFEAFFNEVRGALESIARQRSVTEDSIQDVIQETCKRYFGKIKKGEVVENPKAFLLGILRNVIYEHLRDIQKNADKDKLSIIKNLPDPAEPADTALEREEMGKIAKLCFEGLSDECQELLTLKIIEGKSYGQMAKELNKPHASLHRHCLECLQIMSECLRNKMR